MNSLLANLLLALTWGAMTGRFSLDNLAVGFALAYAVLYASQRVVGPSPYFSRARQVAVFLAFYLWELAQANVRVASDVITPGHRISPGVVAVPLDADTDVEITLLANLINMTPGTLALDVSQDRSVLYVHGMFIDDPAVFRAQIKEGLERRVLEMLR
ncbi:MAG: Na+/H+ antiporter subunit E [Chloroflexi bacterium]|nr:Na+/H+ antiporter subunit E [Chloroflexota bacterium]